MPDKYANFGALEAKESPNDFGIVLHRRSSRSVVIAPHGGGIEPGTSEIATAIAGAELTLYIFEGRKKSDNKDLHITSSRFDEPAWLELLQTAHVAISVHGCLGQDEFVEIGGLPSPLKDRITSALDGFGIDVREPSSSGLAGTDPNNFINRTPGGGVQLEFSRGLRERFCRALRSGSARHFPHGLADAIRAAICSAELAPE